MYTPLWTVSMGMMVQCRLPITKMVNQIVSFILPLNYGVLSEGEHGLPLGYLLGEADPMAMLLVPLTEGSWMTFC